MGFGIWELLLILAIALLLFGTNRLRNLGSDLGTAIKGFRDAMKEPEKKPTSLEGKLESSSSGRTFDGEINRTERQRQEAARERDSAN